MAKKHMKYIQLHLAIKYYKGINSLDRLAKIYITKIPSYKFSRTLLVRKYFLPKKRCSYTRERGDCARTDGTSIVRILKLEVAIKGDLGGFVVFKNYDISIYRIVWNHS